MRNSIRETYWLIAVFCINILILIQDARFDPDPHHDGLIFAGAAAASDGLVPNKDFFSQYGPLTPILQGLFLNFTDVNLLSLKIFMGFLSAFNASIVYLVLSKLSNRYIGISISLLWILQLSTQIPWPSILSTSFILVSILLAIDIQEKGGAVTKSRGRLILSGFLLGVISFVRVHNLSFVILILLFLLIRKFKNSDYLYFLLIGIAFGLFFGFGILAITNALPEYIQQCIVWPLQRYGLAEVNKSYLVGILWFPLISLLSVLYLFALHKFYDYKKIRVKLFFLFGLSILWTAIITSYFMPRDGYLSLRNPQILFIDTLNNFVHFLGFLSVGLVIGHSLITVIKKRMSELDSVITIVSLGTLTQLYPLYDQVHLWFITPVLTVCSALAFRQFLDRKIKMGSFSLFVVPFIVVLTVLSIISWSSPTKNFSSEILSGMKGSQNSVFQIDGTIAMLLHNADSEKIIFDCENGLYAAFNGRYMNANPQYVNWAPGFTSPKSGEEYFVCDLLPSEFAKQLENAEVVAEFTYYSSGNRYYNAILRKK